MVNERNGGISEEITEACHAIGSHAGIYKISSEPEILGNGLVRFVAEVNVPLPSRCTAQGVSRSGVQRTEQIILDFPPEFPQKAPIVRLRKDFPLHFPHINPHRDGEEVRPCVYEGSLDELLQQPNGLNEIINHAIEWLEKAARNDLTNPDQGWEPTRRDGTGKLIIFALDEFQAKITNVAGISEFSAYCLQYDSFFMGRCKEHLRGLANDRKIGDLYSCHDRSKNGAIHGDHLGILAWSNRNAVDTDYFPETVTNLKELIENAEKFGCSALTRRLNLLSDFIYNKQKDFVLKILIVLCARRPYKVIGTDSNLEFLPYLAHLQLQKTGLVNFWDENSRVFSVDHLHDVSPELFRKTSGAKPPREDGIIVQLGCGSLGSKIALHLARAGHGPFRLYDKSSLSPHNYARHGLFNTTDNLFLNKAEALSLAIKSFQQNVEPHYVDIVDHIHSRRKAENVFPKSTTLIIDSSASLSVREALSTIPANKMPPRLMHTGLYASGEVGIMAIEGNDRSPRVDDLAVKLFDCCIDDDLLRGQLNPSDDPFSRINVGQSCGSHTMVMPDSSVSMYAASMAENARKIIEEDDGVSGLWIGSKNGLGITWTHHVVGKTIIAPPCDGQNWEIRILSSVANQMDTEARQYAPNETGGVLIGKVFENRKTVVISRILPPPSDSVRTETKFVLGIKGLKEEVEKIQKASGQTLCYLGTWHSHPRGGQASEDDRQTLKRMVELRLGFPTINLIWTPTGNFALMDEGNFFRG